MVLILLLLPHAVNATSHTTIPPLSAARSLIIVAVNTIFCRPFARHGDVLYTKLPFALWAQVFGDRSVTHIYGTSKEGLNSVGICIIRKVRIAWAGVDIYIVANGR